VYKAKVAVCSAAPTKQSMQSERHVEFLNVNLEVCRETARLCIKFPWNNKRLGEKCSNSLKKHWQWMNLSIKIGSVRNVRGARNKHETLNMTACILNLCEMLHVCQETNECVSIHRTRER